MRSPGTASTDDRAGLRAQASQDRGACTGTGAADMEEERDPVPLGDRAGPPASRIRSMRNPAVRRGVTAGPRRKGGQVGDDSGGTRGLLDAQRFAGEQCREMCVVGDPQVPGSRPRCGREAAGTITVAAIEPASRTIPATSTERRRPPAVQAPRAAASLGHGDPVFLGVSVSGVMAAGS